MIRLTSARVGGAGAVQIGLRRKRVLVEPAGFEERPISDLVRSLVFTAGIVLVGFIWWSAITPIEELVSAPGQVVPVGQIKTIQHLEAGVVSEIAVQDGDRVKEGQLLVRIDPVQAREELHQAQAQSAALQMRIERLRALAEGREPNFVVLQADWPDLAADQRRIWAGQRDSHRAALAVIDSQIDQHRKEANQLRDALTLSQRQLDIASRRLALRQRVAPDAVNAQEIQLDAQSALVTAQGEVNRLRDLVLVASQSIIETQRQRVNQDMAQREAALTETGTVATEMEAIKATIPRLQARIAGLDVRSPVDGIVQDLRIHSPGAVVSPGETLMSVVPADARLQLDVRIAPRDVTRLWPDQPVRIKVRSSDSARYATLAGHLVQVSPTTLIDGQGQPYYKGLIAFDATAPEVPGQQSAPPGPLLPGMVVDAEIVAGTRTLAGYLFRPLTRSVDTAFHEP
ncbi:MAG: HlyD family type I secretion periplasmic adaptor subunit [Azospirillaceae bacterium]|nr:HlyD family type I secretion periplasmic adaptor subunit [Azospirillaceae bacterium]